MKWLALPILLGATSCASPGTNDAPARPSPSAYTARGQEPGWALTIAKGRIDYVGNYGDTRINLPHSQPKTTPTGHRYETPRLTVDVSHGRCNDAMSGHGYADQVTVTADGQTYRGCGGTRRPDWDM